jgi:hypothetical protein
LNRKNLLSPKNRGLGLEIEDFPRYLYLFLASATAELLMRNGSNKQGFSSARLGRRNRFAFPNRL